MPKLSKYLLIIWAAISLLYVGAYAYSIDAQTRAVVAGHTARAEIYNKSLAAFIADCETIRDFSEFVPHPPRPPAARSSNIFEGVFDDIDPRWRRGNDCLPENRQRTAREHALRQTSFFSNDAAWQQWAARNNVSFQSAPMSYSDVLRIDAQVLAGFTVPPIGLFVVGYAGLTIGRRVAARWGRFSPNDRFVIFLSCAWLAIFPPSVFFFGDIYTIEHEDPALAFFGYWLFLPALVSFMWFGACIAMRSGVKGE